MDYGNPLEEHIATRTNVTIFDVSHMGRYVISGGKVVEFLQKLVSKDILKVKRGRMSGPVLLLNEEGGIIDDVMLYNVGEERWFAVVNASNVEKDLKWMISWRNKLGYTKADVNIEDVTRKTALIAIQGPKSPEIMEALGVPEARELKILQFLSSPSVLGREAVLISRSGWTGEEVRSYGFEVWSDVELGRRVFEESVKLGAKPSGLIARDSLRLEMGYLLIGADIGEDFNPIEARYWLALTLGKEGCIGCDKVMEIYRRGVDRIRVGIRLKKGVRAIPRHGSKILADGQVVGEVTSGVFSPYLNRAIGIGYVKTSHAYIGFNLTIVVRGKEYVAKIVDFPFIEVR